MTRNHNIDKLSVAFEKKGIVLSVNVGDEVFERRYFAEAKEEDKPKKLRNEPPKIEQGELPTQPLAEEEEDKEVLYKERVMKEPNFEESVEFVLSHEGGYVKDPNDAGGETNWGISKRSYPDLDIKNLTREKAIEIYRRDFWDAIGADQISHGEIAKKAFDFAVNMGESRAITLLQQAINDVWALSISTDGIIGSETLGAIDTAIERDGWRMLYTAYCHRAAMFYRNLNQPRFLRGWLRRAFS